MEYVAGLAALICIYLILISSLDILLGYVGIFSFAHSAFYGLGAYAAALTATRLGWGFFAAIAIACLVSGLAALLIAALTLRLSGDYAVLGTFGFAMVVSSVLENWMSVTNGPFGVFGIPRINLFGWVIRTPYEFLAVAAAFAALVLWAKHRLVGSTFGLTLKTIREDETVAKTLGKNVTLEKVVVFTLSSVACGIAGTLLAYNLRFIDPSLFTLNSTILIWAMLFVGGCCSIWGNILGPVILIAFPEALRFVGLSGSQVPQIQQALYGVLLVGLMIFRPQGLAGKYRIR